MVFIYSILFYLTFYFTSYIFNINILLADLPEINFSNLIVLLWVIAIFIYLYFFKNISSWSTEIILYIFGIYRSIIENLSSSIYLLISNINLFTRFFTYNTKYISSLLSTQIWTPLFRRGGYLSLLNSSRARWQLSKSNSIFKNK